MSVSKAPMTAVFIGVLLMLVGLLGRFLSGTTSMTALIPLFFGLPIAILGWLSQKTGRGNVMMIIIAVLAGLGIFGTYSAIPDLFQAAGLSASLMSRGSMLILCAVMLIVSLNWVIQNRSKGA